MLQILNLQQSFFDDRIIGCFDVAPLISCCFDPHPMIMPLLFSNYRKLLQCYSSISPWCFKSYYGNPSLIIDSSKALLVLLNLFLMFWILILQQCFFDDRIIENCFEDVALQSLDASNPRLMTMLLWSYNHTLIAWGFDVALQSPDALNPHLTTTLLWSYLNPPLITMLLWS